MKIRLKITAKKTIKYTMALVLLLSFASILYTASYLYDHFYLVLTKNQPVVLSSDKTNDLINIKKFDTVIKAIENKTNPAPYSIINDIF